MRSNFIFYILLCFTAEQIAFSLPIETTSIESGPWLNKDLKKSLDEYLARYIGYEADRNTFVLAENFLLSLKFVDVAACRANEASLTQMNCLIKPKNFLKNIRIIGLPASLLESDLLRKLPVQRGQFQNLASDKWLETLEVSKTRVESFLRKSGFYQAAIEISVISKDWYTEVEIRISGGSFAKVNQVYLETKAPISAKTIRQIYGRMCLSLDKLYDAVARGGISCYTRELEREATDKLQNKLAKMGYVQAGIRVSHDWLDPFDPKTPKACRAKNAHEIQSSCVDLSVSIEAGPKVNWSIEIIDGNLANQGQFAKFLSSVFAINQISRANRALDEEAPPDQTIIRQELEKRINFLETKNVSEVEVRESSNKMKEYLVGIGYINADVSYSYSVTLDSEINILFFVNAGYPYKIQNFSIEPPYFKKFFSPKELNELLPARGIIENGNLSYDKLENMEEGVKRRLEERGFRNISTQVDAVSLEDGRVNVTIYVSVDSREIVESIFIENGDDLINNKIMASLRNCNNAKKNLALGNFKNLCSNSSFDQSGLESDERRVIDYYTNNDYLYVSALTQIIDGKNGKIIKFILRDSREKNEISNSITRQEIKDVVISGNMSTRASVIKRMMKGAKNERRFDSGSIKKGLGYLRESDRFSLIDGKLLSAEQDSDDAYFYLHVVEKPSLSLEGAVAFSTDQLLSLELDLEETNLFSSMLKLNTALGLGFFWGRHSFISNRFVWPYILGKPLKFTLHAPIIYYDDRTYSQRPYRRLQSKISALLEWKVNLNVIPYLRYSLTHTLKEEFLANNVPKLSLRERFASVDGLTKTLDAPSKIRGVIKPGLSVVALDDPTDPRKGVDTNHWTEISTGPFYNGAFFLNLGTQNKFYLPLGNTTLALQATFMRAFVKPSKENWSELIDISAMDNLGGDRSVRGYNDGAIGMTDSSFSSSSWSQGYFLNSANIEWRFPLTGRESLGNFSGAIFMDQGLLLACEDLRCQQKNSWTKIVRDYGLGFSLGAGLRYNLPVGPIVLDYAYSPIHSDWRVHFQFGYSF